MAPTPAGSESALPRASGSPVRLDGVAECLGGEIHLAYSHRPESGIVTVVAALSPEEARDRADLRAAALEALHRLSATALGASTLPEARELDLSDFVPEPPADLRLRVSGYGLLSGEPYLLPAEVVQVGEERDGRVEPTLVGLVDTYPDGASGAIADLIAHDVVTRWWADPRLPLLRVSEHLPRLLPASAASAASALGLWVSAFVLPGAECRIAVVGVGGEGTTIATAAASTVQGAVSEAFLRAVAARAQPWNALPTADSLRRLTVWHREADYLSYLERSAIDPDPGIIDESGVWRDTLDWADIACRRFGHEPVMVGAPHPVKVVCPGAACYRTVPIGTSLPCPVP